MFYCIKEIVGKTKTIKSIDVLEDLARIGSDEVTDGWQVVSNTEELCGLVCHICNTRYAADYAQ